MERTSRSDPPFNGTHSDSKRFKTSRDRTGVDPQRFRSHYLSSTTRTIKEAAVAAATTTTTSIYLVKKKKNWIRSRRQASIKRLVNSDGSDRDCTGRSPRRVLSSCVPTTTELETSSFRNPGGIDAARWWCRRRWRSGGNPTNVARTVFGAAPVLSLETCDAIAQGKTMARKTVRVSRLNDGSSVLIGDAGHAMLRTTSARVATPRRKTSVSSSMNWMGSGMRAISHRPSIGTAETANPRWMPSRDYQKTLLVSCRSCHDTSIN
mmetsp:Transcript_47724/g.51588  ORF Transcript_47724/g.51588 Transcript_47724/m.51588 type:complete len:264 (+) Transcript_47724:929-1720(+)